MESASKTINLLSGVILLAGSLIVLLFFTNLDPRDIYIKPEYSSKAWLVFSISTACYYSISGKRKTKESWNPLFKFLFDSASTVVFIGFLLSFIPGLIESGGLKNLILASSYFLDTTLVFFVLIYLTLGANLVFGAFKKVNSSNIVH
jgi:hypothetical protein